MVKAILIVDPQLDFFPGDIVHLEPGALAVPDGTAIIGPIKRLLEKTDGLGVYLSQDWHPEDTVHFKAGGGIWPPHCVAGTEGADVHPFILDALVEHCKEDIGRVRAYRKGMDPKDDGGYSAFDAVGEGRIDVDGMGNKTWNHEANRPLLEDLREDGVDTLIVCGLATDYCVKASVLDALEHGFRVQLFLDGIRAVNLQPEDGTKAIREMVESGAEMYTELLGGFHQIGWAAV